VYLTRVTQIAAVVSIALFVSAAALPALAGNCGNGVGNGNATCKNAPTGSVAPMPAPGTGIPGMIVLLGGLMLFARRGR
jgi:hypothetical protein